MVPTVVFGVRDVREVFARRVVPVFHDWNYTPVGYLRKVELAICRT